VKGQFPLVLFYVCGINLTIYYRLLVWSIALFGDFLIVQEFRIHFKLISSLPDDLVELVRDLLLILKQRGIRLRPFLLEGVHRTGLVSLILNNSSLYHFVASVPLGEREEYKAGEEDKVRPIEGISQAECVMRQNQ
jgi:hypothetical protein